MDMIAKTHRASDDRTFLLDIVRRQKQGEPSGIYSVCSANRFVLEASLKQAVQYGSPVLIESTSNQVNQYGGYMGMNPRQFASHLASLAEDVGLPARPALPRGEHLRPHLLENKPPAN